jgi:hypothetical protein
MKINIQKLEGNWKARGYLIYLLFEKKTLYSNAIKTYIR